MLTELNSKVTDKAIQIKVNEVSNILEEVDKTTKINDGPFS